MYEICRDPAYRKLVALWSHLQTTDDINDRIPLSFHAVSFGPERCSDVLRRIVDIAQEVENSVSHNPLIIKSVPSSFAKASDTVSVEWLRRSEIDINLIRSI